MKELLEHIVKSIVNHPDSVVIDEKESQDFPGLTILTIDVAEDDKGVVIGRKGRTINAIRDLITIHAIRNDKRVKVLIKDDKAGHHDETEVSHNVIEEQVPVVDGENMLEDEI
ncbi:KH domain-containing protein [Patescibacteria group bacterium]|nr:KH domain-containing protein [Patescibacteria group bacterium]